MPSNVETAKLSSLLLNMKKTRHRRCRVLQSPHAEGVHAEGVKETLNPEPSPQAGCRHAEGGALVVRQEISTLVLPDHPSG